MHRRFIFLRSTSLDSLYRHLIYNSWDIVCSLCYDCCKDIYGILRGKAMTENTVKKVALLVCNYLQYLPAVDLAAGGLKAQMLAVAAAMVVLRARLQPARAQGPARVSALARALAPAPAPAWSQAVKRKA